MGLRFWLILREGREGSVMLLKWEFWKSGSLNNEDLPSATPREGLLAWKYPISLRRWPHPLSLSTSWGESAFLSSRFLVMWLTALVGRLLRKGTVIVYNVWSCLEKKKSRFYSSDQEEVTSLQWASTQLSHLQSPPFHMAFSILRRCKADYEGGVNLRWPLSLPGLSNILPGELRP